MTKTREIVAYMAIAAAGAALLVAGLFLPGIPKSVAKKSDVQAAISAAAGAGAVAKAESEVQSQATQAGIVITKMTVDHVASKGNKPVVYLVLQTANAGTIRLAVTLEKSAYQVTDIKRVS